MKKFIVLITALLSITIAGCGANNQNNQGSSDSSKPKENQQEGQGQSPSKEHNEHEGMEHSGSSEIPEGMKEAQNPKYEVGSTVIVAEGHMPGMKGAEATVVNAYDTTVYRVSYDPVSGGDRVEKHEWVVHEELKETDEKPFKPGSEVTIEAEHMEGMQGASAVVDTAEQKTVYVIDFTLTDGSEKVMNHLWVTEEELSPIE
ncbi:hypothetical protein JOC78_003480 [Bacillus ectoiniformans]|uniref:YdhK family protein n=1 Tax=Bacillus ectoiniformans TaxID=1494429 RepID=UPI00195EEF80|nr:YdhK family protein [Bacillus ectoiniformans]MBM7650488.1 hypothetical protein [Bacillus ectoiniformans]